MDIQIVPDSRIYYPHIVCSLARGIQLSTFSKGGMLILPYLVPGVKQAVFFPDLNYSSDFWHEISQKTDYSLTAPFSPQLLGHVKKYADLIPSPPDTDFRNALQKSLPGFLSTLEAILPAAQLPQILDVKIIPIAFGTAGTFSVKRNQNNSISVLCTVRTDLGVNTAFDVVTQGIILSTQKDYADVGTLGWLQRIAVLAFLRDYTRLKAFLTVPPTGAVLTPANLKDSRDYSAKLGFPQQPIFDPEAVRLNLTPNEQRLFNCLYSNRGALVSFDDAATAVWQEEVDEKYSLYALSKLVENLRRKIRAKGLSYEAITTLRKQGYVLVD